MSLDLGAAAVIGLVSIAIVSYASPLPSYAAASAYLQEGAIRGYLLTVVESEGIPWFQNSSFAQVCALVTSASNSTFGVSADVHSVRCGPLPPAGAVTASLAFRAGDRQVALLGWKSGGG